MVIRKILNSLLFVYDPDHAENVLEIDHRISSEIELTRSGLSRRTSVTTLQSAVHYHSF